MSVDALEAPTNEHPILRPAGGNELNPYANVHIGAPESTAPAEDLTRLHVINLPEGYGSETAEMANHYRDVVIDENRRPLLRAPDVHRFIGNEYPGRPAPDYGELMLEITLPLPSDGDITAPDATRARDYSNNTMYVFRRNTNDRPEYTILSPSTLYDATVNPKAAEANGAILRINARSDAVVVGTDSGNWMPGVGRNTALLEQTRKMQGGRRTVSRVQGIFYVDRRGSLHYAESVEAKNSSTLRLNRTRKERLADERQEHLTRSIDASYAGRLATHRLVNGRPERVPEVEPLVTLEPEDFVSADRGSAQPAYTREPGAEDQRYIGRHRHSLRGALGRLATRFFGKA